ncbi:MAG TPA: hypothetical protein VLY04_03590 [Bryobacteraceae bacterium]|nr:hypothetical protein [Bryobacteraceae bacterium]
MPFQCSICGEESTRICSRCTKDACDNHLCEKCRMCSDCCECEVALEPPVREPVAHPALEPEPEPAPDPTTPEPEVASASQAEHS